MCPSPYTRSPIAKPRTSCPISTISPTYSWPTCIGTGIVFCAQSSHFQMWMSVPQIAVFAIRIITSLWPTSGFFTRVRVSPGARSSLASAFIASLQHADGMADFAERGDGPLDLRLGVGGGHLRADARLALRHDRIRKADHVDAFGEQRIGHPRGERGVAQHHGDDRMRSGHEIKAQPRHFAPEALAVFAHSRAERRTFGTPE